MYVEVCLSVIAGNTKGETVVRPMGKTGSEVWAFQAVLSQEYTQSEKLSSGQRQHCQLR